VYFQRLTRIFCVMCRDEGIPTYGVSCSQAPAWKQYKGLVWNEQGYLIARVVCIPKLELGDEGKISNMLELVSFKS